MKRVANDFAPDYERRPDELIKPEEETLFDSIEDAQKWLQEIIDFGEDQSDNEGQ